MIGNILICTALAVFAAVISLFTLKYAVTLPAPYLWLALTWAVVLLCALRLVPRARIIWISGVVIIGVLAGLEGYFWIAKWEEFKDIAKGGTTFSWEKDDLLGYVAPKGTARRDEKIYRGKTLYDVVYTMDANGLRISPSQPPSVGTNQPCVLFFGDSYTFGWGLNDQDTLPYRVATMTDGKYRVYNLSFPTHGAHQMLAALEQGIVSKEIACAPQDVKYIIYTATPDQVRRAGGLRTIDTLHGPRYVLGTDGNVSYRGQFGVNQSRAEKIRSQLEKSLFYRKLVGGDAIYLRRYNGGDVKLYLAIVDSARTLAKKLYPESEFHIMAWGNDPLDRDEDGVLRTQMIEGLINKGLLVHRVNDVLPGSDDNKPEYFMGEFSLHPTAATNERIAAYIVHDILKQ